MRGGASGGVYAGIGSDSFRTRGFRLARTPLPANLTSSRRSCVARALPQRLKPPSRKMSLLRPKPERLGYLEAWQDDYPLVTRWAKLEPRRPWSFQIGLLVRFSLGLNPDVAWQTYCVNESPPTELLSRRRVLIVAKTYPELSTKYGETVCTAGVDELGRPLRLYPIPFRYLAGPEKFSRYQWIEASIRKSPRDTRPESHTVDQGSIILQQSVGATNDEWGKRADVALRSADWQFTSMKTLSESQRNGGRSLAFMRPSLYTGVSIHRRAPDDAKTFEEKLKKLRERHVAASKQLDLFESTVPTSMKSLDYIGERVCIDWRCSDSDCAGHSMQVLDWEICELARRNGIESAIAKVKTILDSSRYKTALILGNFHMFPSSFAVIGLWYPLLSNRLF